jgi:hypothetical protein
MVLLCAIVFITMSATYIGKRVAKSKVEHLYNSGDKADAMLFSVTDGDIPSSSPSLRHLIWPMHLLVSSDKEAS